MPKNPPRSLRVRLFPDRLRLTFDQGPDRPVVAVGTGLRGEPVDHWSPCVQDGAGQVGEIDLAAVVARYPQDAVVDLWFRQQPIDAKPGDDGVRRLGRFPVTVREDPLAEVVVAGTPLRLRVNVHGNVGFLLGRTWTPRPFEVDGTHLELVDGRFSFTGTVTAFDRQLASARLTVSSPLTGAETAVDLTTEVDEEASRGAFGAVVHRVSGSVDVSQVAARLTPEDKTIEPRLRLTDTAGEEHAPLFKRPSTLGTLACESYELSHGVAHLVPRFNFLSGNLRFSVDTFSPEAFAMLRRMTKQPWWLPAVRRLAGIWLVGEVPYKAQDNGYHLFRWIRKHRPLRLAYYVVDADAPDRERVEPLGRVVLKGSAKHVLLASCASRIVGTHHTEYLLPTADPDYVRSTPGTRVMIQHGIMGTKNLVTTYGRVGTSVLWSDVFHVSSPRERQIVVDDLGFAPEQVRVTGLPRFDSLLAPPRTPPRGVLVIPTWRSWIVSPEQLERSRFYARWTAFLESDALRRLAASGERVSFILHPNMRLFAPAFEELGYRVYQQGERAVQDLLREHAALVTDYSSVAFDFALQGRPVFYFQFDRDAYFREGASHLDLDAELPGPVFTDEDDLAAQVVASAGRGFPMEDDHRTRAQAFFPAGDRSSTRRVYESVRRARPFGR